MKGPLLLILGILFTVGCAEKLIEKPENLIPKEKMVDVIYDIMLMQSLKSTSNKSLEKLDYDIMSFIYSTHQIDSAQFVSSDVYYASIPLEYQSIYESVQARLEKKKDELAEKRKSKNDSARTAVQKRTDSLKKSGLLKKAGESLQ